MGFYIVTGLFISGLAWLLYSNLHYETRGIFFRSTLTKQDRSWVIYIYWSIYIVVNICGASSYIFSDETHIVIGLIIWIAGCLIIVFMVDPPKKDDYDF